MRLSQKLERVEKYGFTRSSFPIEMNDHLICILHNDAYFSDDGYICIDIELWCYDCERSATGHGKVAPEKWDPTMVKLYILGAYTETCAGVPER